MLKQRNTHKKRQKQDSPRYRRHGSGVFSERKSMVSRIVADSSSQERVPRINRYQQRQSPYQPIFRHHSNSNERNSQTKIILKPILPLGSADRSQVICQPPLTEAISVKEGEVQQLFYRQVRLMQQFKALQKLVR